MAKNKNKKSQPPPNQERIYDRGRGGGRRGRGGRGGGGDDGGGGNSPSHGKDGFRGDGPSSNSRGGPPSFVSGYGFGRGRGERGRGISMGRGRGFRGIDSGGFTGNFRGGRPVYHQMDEDVFEIQQWSESPQSGRNTPGGRGRGSPSKSNENNAPRTRGGFTPKLRSTSSLSRLWYEERPLLRPIKFVRSVETATLFQEAEELLEPTVQYPDETAESHVPTADKVSRVFSSTHPHLFDNSLFEIEEGIEEVNFEDLALVHERVLNLNSAPTSVAPSAVQNEVFFDASRNIAPKLGVQREQTSGITLAAEAELPNGQIIKDTTEAVSLIRDGPTGIEADATITAAEPSALFSIDTNPSMSQDQISIPTYHVHLHTGSPGDNVQVEVEPDPEDDVIVYDAPNPRISTPKVETNTLTNISFPNHTLSSSPRQINPLRRGKFVHVVGRNSRRGSAGILGVKRKKLTEHKNFASFGAMIAEARLRSHNGEEDKDPKEHLRRQGDSDLDWGEETDEEEREDDPVAATAEGMDLDPDLVGSGVTMAQMARFAEGVNGNRVAIDEEVNAKGDSPSDDDGEIEHEGVSEDQDFESDEEGMLIEEFRTDPYGSGSSDDDDDDELNPIAGFQARLDRLRRKQQKIVETEDDENEDEMDSDFQWDEGEEIDDLVEGALDKYEKNRVSRNAVFRAIQDGFFDELRPKASSSKYKELPVELQEQWDKDRFKKAKRKRERELARLEAALDPLVTKKGGKKSKKAMITAARLDPSIEIPHQMVDIVTVEQRIRSFLADKNKNDMAFPACDNRTRKKIHILAALFTLKSKSKGGGLGRYVTLFKKKDSGKNVDEREVARVMEGFKYRSWYEVSDDDLDDIWKGKTKGRGKGKGKGKGKLKEKGEEGRLKTREGDVVGHAAPKIDETNIGFMMLTSMGWSDGTTIGLSGGLDAPLTAVIKKTKLGLGASVSTKF